MKVAHNVLCVYAPHRCEVGEGGSGCSCCSEEGGKWRNRDAEKWTHLPVVPSVTVEIMEIIARIRRCLLS